MQRTRAGRSLALLVGASLLACVFGPGAATATESDVSFDPPQLILRGEAVTLQVGVPDEGDPTGVAYVRAGSSGRFTKLPMAWNSGHGRLVAKVPARLLAGSIVEEYVMVRFPATGRSVTVPPAGAAGPFRSRILDRPSTVKLARHRFGHLRSATTIAARAEPGSGPGEAGFACPAEGRCAEPASFDVEADGTVWVADTANHRLLVWEPGHAMRPSRTIPLDYTPLELAVAPDHTVYVRGVKPGVFPSRLFALDRSGRQLWWSNLASDDLFTHLRFGSGGVLYTVVVPWGPWTPVMDRDGAPLGIADQVANVRSGQPIAGGRRLIVDARWVLPRGQLAPRDWRAAIATKSGKLRRAWRIRSLNDLDLSMAAVPTVVGGDPLLVFEVYRFSDHTMEHVVVRLSASGGIRDRFSLGRGGIRGGDVVTDVRVGGDGRLYQLLSDPAWGLEIAQYEVIGPSSPSAAPSPSPTPASVTPAPSPSPKPNPTRSSAVASPVLSPSPTLGPSSPTSSGRSDEMWPAVGLGIMALLGALAAWRSWARRARQPPGPRGT
ncbi:MAG TPA: hypothetical protein VES19_01405 [Candidatus Limnocylindrales bacterium]|nr:hypothetical protein [Candidatus Limnocylindrales bacterium]